MDPHRRPGSAVDVVKLVIRSRTQLFLQYRQEFSTGSGGRHHGARGGYGGYGDKDRLVDSPQGISMDDYTEVAPKWVIVSEQAEKKMDEIQDKLKELKKHISDAAMVGFDEENDVKQQKIEETADDLTSLFVTSQKLIRQIKTDSEAENDENKARSNAQIALATRLQGLSTEFRKEQTSYLNRLKGTEDRVKAIGKFDDDTGFNADFSGLEDKGFTDAQLAAVAEEENLVTEREREIANIAKSINELASIFRDMQAMVIDQGTILDQIEHNMEQVVEGVTEGHKEIVKADQYQKSARNKLCVIFLIVVVVALIIALSFKPR